MLPRKHRIQRKDFLTGSRQGFRVFSSLFTLVAYPSTAGTRISVVVSKKTAKTAITRNALRRRLYAVIAPHLKGFSRDTLVVLYPKIEAKNTPFSTLSSEMENALRQAKLIP